LADAGLDRVVADIFEGAGGFNRFGVGDFAGGWDSDGGSGEGQ